MIDFKVVMYQNISNPGDVVPRDLRTVRLEFLRELCRGLPDHFKVMDDPGLNQLIRDESFVSSARLLLNALDSFQNIQ